MNRSTFFLAAMATLAGWGMAGDANAVTSPRSWLSHGPGHCQSNLPTSEVSLRKRPQALANEGTTSVFVTCDFDNIDNFSSGMSQIIVAYRNRTETPVIVTCTLVNGFLSQPGGTFFPKSEIAPALSGPEGGIVALTWTAVDDNEGANFTVPALSCQIPAGAEIGAVLGDFTVEIGS